LNLDMLQADVIVNHKMYGNGKIISNDGKTLTIYFDKIKKKRKLDLKYCVQNSTIAIVGT